MTIPVTDYADTAMVISATRMLAQKIGFNQTTQYLIATAASELATNIVRYAGSGQITLNAIHNDHNQGIEIVSRDNGPGIADIAEAMADHFSTGNGLGLGLASVKRIMDEFTIQSQPNQGTIVSARKWK